MIEYFQRGWSGSNAFRVEGKVMNSKGSEMFKVEGRWNDSVSIIESGNGKKEVIWKKAPYPENWDLMYGMSHVGLQHNYFPQYL